MKAFKLPPKVKAAERFNLSVLVDSEHIEWLREQAGDEGVSSYLRRLLTSVMEISADNEK